MHEVSLIESVVAIVADEHKRQAFSRVRAIRLEVGALGHAEPEALRFCFDAVTKGTIADGAQLTIDIVLAEGICTACGQPVAMLDRFETCPLCGSSHVLMTAGGELRVADLEVE